MIPSKVFNSGCMRLETTREYEGHRKAVKAELSARRKRRNIGERLTKRKLAELLFENCVDCGKMAAIPQGAFAVNKVRRNDVLISPMDGKEKPKENIYNARPPVGGWELTPLKYNSKLMNSIWGLYNRYSVHNFKKNTDADEGVFCKIRETLGVSPAANASVVAAAFPNHRN